MRGVASLTQGQRASKVAGNIVVAHRREQHSSFCLSSRPGLLEDAADERPFAGRVEVVSAGAKRGIKRRLTEAHERADGSDQHVALADQGADAGWLLNVNVSYEFSRYSAVAILAALDSVLGAVRAELDGVYDNRIFISGFVTNAVVAVILTFIGDRLGLDLYLVALISFGFRIFNNVALIRRHFI